MKVKRIAIDISKHAFTLHGVDDQERPVLRRDLKRAEVETELRVDAGGLGPAQDDHRSRRQARHAVYTCGQVRPQSCLALACGSHLGQRS